MVSTISQWINCIHRIRLDRDRGTCLRSSQRRWIGASDCAECGGHLRAGLFPLGGRTSFGKGATERKRTAIPFSAACQVLALTIVLIYFGSAKRTILSSRETEENESRIPRGCYGYLDRLQRAATREL